jgi:cystinosin
VRFNDFLFAAHGAAMCVIIYSQFFTEIWGFTIGRTQKASRAVLGIFWGLVAGVMIVAFMAMFWSRDGGYDASGWAWIDVVSTCHIPMRGYRGLLCFSRPVFEHHKVLEKDSHVVMPQPPRISGFRLSKP